VVVAVETTGCTTLDGAIVLDGSIADNLTFCDEGVAAMDAELDLIANAFADEEGFAGFAVHHWGSYADASRMAP